MLYNKHKMEIIGSVPVKPVLHQFAIVQENVQEEKIIDLNSGGLISYMINMMLGDKAALKRLNEYEFRETYSKPLLFRFTARKVNRFKISFNAQAISVVNKSLHLLLHEILLSDIIRMRKYGVSEQDVIHSFIDQYGLFELISFEGLKKANYRLRKSKNLPVFTARKVKRGLTA